MSRNPGEKFTVSKSLITNPFGDKTPEIILVPGKPGFGASPRRPKCLLMQQHGLFPKSAFRRHRANIEDPLGKSGRESLDQIGPYFRRRTRLRIGTRSQLDLHHWTDVGRFTAGCGIMEEQRLAVWIGSIVNQVPRCSRRKGILEPRVQLSFEWTSDSLLAGQFQLFQPFFTLLVAWRLFRPFLPVKAQEAPVENDNQ